jgi:hypothetical protein
MAAHFNDRAAVERHRYLSVDHERSQRFVGRVGCPVMWLLLSGGSHFRFPLMAASTRYQGAKRVQIWIVQCI